MLQLLSIDEMRLRFPFPPYPSQVQYMQALVQALNGRYNALLESPTGTGKTLSLLLPALTYQAHYLEFAKMVAVLAGSRGPVDKSATAECADVRNQLLSRSGRAHELLQWAEKTLDLRGCILINQHLKQVSLHGSMLAILQSVPPPKIVYTARTHAQIEQAMVQLKRHSAVLRESLGASLPMGWPAAMLGSRRVFCVNDRARAYAAAAHITLDMACKKVCDDRQCIYYFTDEAGNDVMEHYRDHCSATGKGALPDIEDFIGYCKATAKCPYYLGRALVAKAGLVTSPYNYVLSGSTRSAELSSMLTNSVVLIDEGHNFSQVCCDIFSGEVCFDALEKAAAEVEYIQNIPRKNSLIAGERAATIELQGNLNPIRNTRNITTPYNGLSEPKRKHIQQVDVKVHSLEDSLPPREDVALCHMFIKQTLDYFTSKCTEVGHKYPIILPAQPLAKRIFTLLCAAKFTGANECPLKQQKLRAATDKETADYYFSGAAGASAGTATSSLSSELQTAYQNQRQFGLMMDTLTIFLQSNAALAPEYMDKVLHIPDAKEWLTLISNIMIYSQQGTEFYFTIVQIDCSTGDDAPSEPGLAGNFSEYINNSLKQRLAATGARPSAKPRRQIHLVCMAAEFILRSIIRRESVRSLILTSGTLTPFEALKTELGIPFKAAISCPHIVSPSNYLARIIKGVGCTSLLGTYKSRDDAAYQRALGYALHTCVHGIIGGTLVFFASYKYMSFILDVWKRDGLMERLRKGLSEGLRDLFVEAPGQHECDALVKRYKDSCNAGKSPILFVVCRGKLAEGIDFSDAYCRCAVVVSLPYANLTDPLLKLKMEWLDKNSALKGSEWYSAQAYRSVNQALGRVIRHKDDYGCMFLLDQRYVQDVNQNRLSGWLAQQFKYVQLQGTSLDSEALLNEVAELYSRHGHAGSTTPAVSRASSIATVEKKPLTVQFDDGNEMSKLLKRFEAAPRAPVQKCERAATPTGPSNSGHDDIQKLLAQLKTKLPEAKYRELKSLLYDAQLTDSKDKDRIHNICSNLAMLLASRIFTAETRSLLKVVHPHIASELENQISFLRRRQ